MDEIQLMGVGLETSCQLDAFRRRLGTHGVVHSIWMSATPDLKRLETVDQKVLGNVLSKISLEPYDLQWDPIKKRLQGSKPVIKSQIVLNKDMKKEYCKDVSDLIIREHRRGSITLVIVNSVSRAQEIYKLLEKQKPTEELLLVHSRFRIPDRTSIMHKLLSGGNLIAVSTQAIEAGVDISASTLISELAPWSSMVQRFGRCNRNGDDQNAKIVWIDNIATESELTAPYSAEELTESRSRLEKLKDCSIEQLVKIKPPQECGIHHVIRQKDLLELFDTTPDLTGTDMDISRYIRERDDIDLQVFWRKIPESGPTQEERGPFREELCPVLISNARGFLEKHSGWVWDHLGKKYQKVGKDGIM
ncbi:MAG: CRISPR-associated helicase Cas3', partial [Candidatus Thermoplasmatota archaeon]|nr:CRISPR-associated helicase Cas3' [Candidatus Thermoplasmatota archaeon]